VTVNQHQRDGFSKQASIFVFLILSGFFTFSVKENLSSVKTFTVRERWKRTS
jgi:hypothetical protein